MLTESLYTLRLLRRSPAVPAAAALTLALGIGLTTAVTSVVHGILWRPLPYPEPDRLIRIWESQAETGRIRAGVSRLSIAHWRAHASTLESIGEYSTYFQGDFLEIGDRPVNVRMAIVDPEFIRTMTLAPSPVDAGYLLGHSFRRSVFGEESLLGTPVRVERHQEYILPVLGTLPPEFDLPAGADVWMVRSSDLSLDLRERRSRRFEAVARLKPGVSRADAQRELDALSADLAMSYPDSHRGWRPETAILTDVILGSARAPLHALGGASLLVLLIAWLNVAGLLAARRLERAREAAIRHALGAPGPGLASGRALEGAAIAVTGIAGAALVAWAAGHMLLTLLGGAMVRSPASTIEWSWFGLISGASLLATVIVSLPGGRGARDLSTLRPQVPMGQTRSTARSALIVLQAALALVLLVGAMLLGASFIRLMGVDPGFDTRSLVTVTLRQPIFKPGEVVRHYPLERFARIAREAVAIAGAAGGVRNAAVLSFAPFTGDRIPAGVILLDGPVSGSPQARGVPRVPEEDWITIGDRQMVSPEFFQTLGIPVVRGRPFTEHDTLSAAQFDDFEAPRPPGVVIVSEAFAERLWPGEDPVGKYVRASGVEYSSSEVVGMVPDVRYAGLAHEVTPTLYAPFGQGPMVSATLLVRTEADPAGVLPHLRAALGALGSDVAIGDVRSVDHLIQREAAPRRFSAGVMAFFGSVGLGLAVLGLAGTIAFLVRRRTAEIGLRLALGATPPIVVGMFLRQALGWIGLGMLLGLGAASLGARFIDALLFGVGSADVPLYAAACVVLVAAALGAAYVPARAAARVDPMTSLRVE
jgi:putative ABC transport system permease protein